MRIPIEWLNEYVKIPKNISVLTDGLTMAGHMLDKIDNTKYGTVIDLELRGNRADCYSILGIAREVSAIFKTPLTHPKTDTLHKTIKKISGLFLKADSNYVKRVMMVKINNVKITKSPDWLKNRLSAYGIEPLNNIVDLTNHVMLETGEPMHAFDADRIGGDVFIRIAKKGEKIITFQNKTIVLTDDDLVWSNNKNILSVAGAIGSKEFSITDNTQNIILEAASYEQANIRRTIYRHNLLTDAGIRHEKKLDPTLVEEGIRRYLYLIKNEGWGEMGGELFDFYPSPITSKRITLYYDYINRLSGFEIDKKISVDVLRRLNMKIVGNTKDSIQVIPPSYRTDIESKEDLVEEILRIVGYDKIPNNVLSLEIPPDKMPEYIEQERSVKNILISLGFEEVISIPFTAPKYQLLNSSLSQRTNPVIVANRPSPEIEEMRMNMLPSLVEPMQKTINEHGEISKLFEVGKIYSQKSEKYTEYRAAGILYWEKDGMSYRKFKGKLEAFFTILNIADVKYEESECQILTESFKILLENNIVGIGGNYKGAYFAEIYLDNLLGKSRITKVNLWPKHPPQIEDMTIKIPRGVMAGEVMQKIKSSSTLVSEVELKDTYNISYTFRISYQHPEKTLTNKEVEKARNSISIKLKNDLNLTLDA